MAIFLHLILRIKTKGHHFYLMSDAGLPAIDDPGTRLIRRCHAENITVSASPFSNSHLLALALSGFSNGVFTCLGFPPRSSNQRSRWFHDALQRKEVLILLDTPYRLEKTVSELSKALKTLKQIKQRHAFLAMNLNAPNELLLFGTLTSIEKNLPKNTKAPFIIVLESHEA